MQSEYLELQAADNTIRMPTSKTFTLEETTKTDRSIWILTKPIEETINKNRTNHTKNEHKNKLVARVPYVQKLFYPVS